MDSFEPQESGLERVLHTHYQRELGSTYGSAPDTSKVWLQIAPQLESHTIQNTSLRRSTMSQNITVIAKKTWVRLTTRVGIIAASFVLLLMGSVAAYAALPYISPLVQNVMEESMSVQEKTKGTVTDVQQSQTINGVKITVDKVSVNEEYVTVGFLVDMSQNVNKADKDWFLQARPTLSTKDGKQLEANGSILKPDKDTFDLTDAEQIGYAASYYVKAIEGMSGTIDLQLTFPHESKPVTFNFSIKK